MGSPLQVCTPPGAVLSMTVVPLALVASLVALLVAAPLARAASPGIWKTPPPSAPPSSEGSSEENPDLNPDFNHCCREDCSIPSHCTEICELCCSVGPGTPLPPECKRYDKNPYYLVAKIALGAALVVAISALASVVLRTCSGNRRRRSEQRPPFRPAGGSTSSLDVYIRERMHDCPPCYDEISWEKPPSYSNLSVAEQSASDAQDRREPPRVSNLSEPPGPVSPPPYSGIVFTISQHVEQCAPQTASADAHNDATPTANRQETSNAAAGRTSADA